MRIASPLLFASLILGLTTQCSSVAPAPSPAAAAAESLDSRPLSVGEEATILRMEDRRSWEPEVAATWMSHPNASHRERMALALGRIGTATFDDPDGDGVLDTDELPAGLALLIDAGGDPQFEVRRAVAFSLGEIAHPSAVDTLLALSRDEHADVASEAVEALSKIGEPVPFETIRALAADPREGVRLRTARFLFRYPPGSATPLAVQLLGSSDTELRREAVYSLSRRAAPEARDPLLLLLDDPDTLTRSYAVRALGLIADASTLPRLIAATGDSHPWVRTNAARSVRQIVTRSELVPRSTLGSDSIRLLTLLRDEDPGTRAAAIEALGPWSAVSDPVREALITIAVDGGGAEREIAAGTLAQFLGIGEGSPASALLQTDDPWVRMRILEGAAEQAEAVELRARLATAEQPILRAAAIRTVPDERLAAETGLVRQGLDDEDVVVRATAIGRLTTMETIPSAERVLLLRAALARAGSDTLNDARMAAAEGLAGIDHEGRIALLDELADDADPVLARAAAEALRRIAADRRSRFTPLRSHLRESDYQSIAEWSRQPHSAVIRTSRGDISIALLSQLAPMTTWNFARLARSGYFDGTTFMRVVPNFVIQGGDPRNDQSGGPGYAIRDEINMQKYTRGAVGMALSGPDTGGSQFFIVHSPQHHLDGGYTIFGRVTDGMIPVVDKIERGDRVLTISIDDAPREITTAGAGHE